MNVTLSLDDKLVKDVRKIAVERDTTLTGMVRAYLEQVAAEHTNSDQRHRELEALEDSFKRFSADLRYGERTWKREDLYERKSK
jgi:hypothetical protein